MGSFTITAAAFAVLAAALCSSAAVKRVTVARQGGANAGASHPVHRFLRSDQPVPDDTQVAFTVYLKQAPGSPEKLTQTFHAVSDPDSARYGQYLTKAEVDAMLQASPRSWAAVDAWLASFPQADMVVERFADAVAVTTTASVATKMFDVAFHEYRMKARAGAAGEAAGPRVVLASGDATLPAHVAAEVDIVTGLTELWRGRFEKHPKATRAQEAAGSSGSSGPKGSGLPGDHDVKITPAVLKTYYGIPADEANAGGDKNVQAIAAFNDYYSAGALTRFNTKYSLPDPDITAVGVDCLMSGKPCDQVESDLDVQYITAIGQGVKTVFYNTNQGWVLDFTQNVGKLSPMPLVFSISYGWAELRQCDIAFEVCDKLGYTASQYVARANTGLQRLAVMGVTIMVSDGDDGAQSVQPDGTDPIDPKRWCGGDPYACYPETKSKCVEISLTNTSIHPKPTCPWPVGSLSDICSWLFLGDFYQDADIIKALQDANPTCKLQNFIDGDLGSHLYSECACEELAPIYHKGVTSEVYKYNKTARIFYADFPTDSPYVTSMGATAFKSDDGKNVNAEHTASIVDGAIITTGGGFSALAPQPKWQAGAVQDWVTNAPDDAKPPSNTYDTSMRGYPDVSFNGHNYQVFAPIAQKGRSCPCKEYSVDGTSASSPAFAGLVSLLNGHLLAAGKSALGFLNPLLYKMQQDKPEAYLDITYGDNKCTRDYCMIYGYNATKGWDPVSGLGTVHYPLFKAYVLAARNITV